MLTKAFFIVTLTVLVQVNGRPHSDHEKTKLEKGLAGGANIPLYHEITNRMKPKSLKQSSTEAMHQKTSHDDTIEVHLGRQASNGPETENLMPVTQKPKTRMNKKAIKKKAKSLKTMLKKKNRAKLVKPKQRPTHPKKKSKYPKKYNARLHSLKKSASKSKQKKLDKLKQKREKRAKKIREHHQSLKKITN